MSKLAERLIAVHRSLATVGIPHAFGGAIALAYCVTEPRGTRDVDVDVFLGPEEADRVLAALPDGVHVGADDRAAIARDGQVRLWWDGMPVDLFFAVHEVHRFAESEIRTVPFEGVDIPVLGCTSLVVFKAVFGRGKDWADIDAMIEAGTPDCTAALHWVKELLGSDDHAVAQLVARVLRGRHVD
jgi:hypothetical protein